MHAQQRLKALVKGGIAGNSGAKVNQELRALLLFLKYTATSIERRAVIKAKQVVDLAILNFEYFLCLLIEYLI